MSVPTFPGVAPTLIVDTPAALLDALPQLTAPGPWALDTEFMRVDTYYPRLCLLQVATATSVICIDPLAVPDLGALAPALADPARMKLMHAARQDLEALSVHGGFQIAGVVDTQIAAGLLGLPEQVGYAWLVEHYEGVVLDKSQTRTDWAQRPLTAAQWHYAAQDVVHLLPLWARMSAALEAAGKRDWLTEECARLTVEDNTPPAQRVKGLNQCDGPSLAIAQALAEWREHQARTLNRPRNWILRDEVLVEIARRRPRALPELSSVSGMPPATLRRHGEALLAVCQEAAGRPLVVERPALTRLTPEQTAMVVSLQERVKACADACTIVPTLLATRRELERVVLGLPVPRLQSGWRAGLLAGVLPPAAIPEAAIS